MAVNRSIIPVPLCPTSRPLVHLERRSGARCLGARDPAAITQQGGAARGIHTDPTVSPMVAAIGRLTTRVIAHYAPGKRTLCPLIGEGGTAELDRHVMRFRSKIPRACALLFRRCVQPTARHPRPLCFRLYLGSAP